MVQQTNRKSQTSVVRGVDTEYGSLIRELKRKHGAGDVGARSREIDAEVWVNAVRKLSKQSPESVAEWLSREIGRTVSVEGMYAQLSRYRNVEMGRFAGGIANPIGGDETSLRVRDDSVGVTVPTIFETEIESEHKRIRSQGTMRDLRVSMSVEDREIARFNNAALKRLKRVNLALEEGRISEADYPRYLSGELKLPRGKNVNAKTVTAETVEVESSLPSKEFFDERTPVQ